MFHSHIAIKIGVILSPLIPSLTEENLITPQVKLVDEWRTKLLKLCLATASHLLTHKTVYFHTL